MSTEDPVLYHAPELPASADWTPAEPPGLGRPPRRARELRHDNADENFDDIACRCSEGVSRYCSDAGGDRAWSERCG